MIHALDTKILMLTPPAAIVNGATPAVGIVDHAGFEYAVFDFLLGATDIALTALKLQESDDPGMAGATDVPGTRFGTDANDTGTLSVLPSATDDNKVFGMAVDLRGRKRYLRPVPTIGAGGAGGFLVVTCRLSRAHEAPYTAAKAGYAQRMIV